MSSKSIHPSICRKYENERTFFRIADSESWWELRINGPFFSYAQYSIQTFMDRQRWNDIAQLNDPFLIDISETEFMEKLNHAQQNLKTWLI